MPSLDIVSRIDFAELDNAVNNTLKAVASRFDFRGLRVEIAVDRKEKKIKMTAPDEGKLKGLYEMFQHAAVKRGLHPRSFDAKEIEQGRHGEAKREVVLKEGLNSDLARQIVKMVKETGLKVQASIQGEEVRLTGKQIDDLRAVMRILEGADPPLAQPLQYVNMKS